MVGEEPSFEIVDISEVPRRRWTKYSRIVEEAIRLPDDKALKLQRVGINIPALRAALRKNRAGQYSFRISRGGEFVYVFKVGKDAGKKKRVGKIS